VQSIATLNAALARATQPWRLDWSKIATVEPSAVDMLRRLFAGWGAQPVQLRFIGADNLDRALKLATPSGDKSVDPDRWRLRIEALRIMHRPDEFELAALDYCVTYEVSPPSWENAKCEFKALDADGGALAGHTLIGEVSHDSIPSDMSGGFGDTQTHAAQSSHAGTHVSVVELAGQIQGDASASLEQLEAKLLGSDVMVISCAKLIRVDFSAAGTLLNWVSARQAEGRLVQFTELSRLVAVFFNVIGISEHSKVSARAN
jgi:ABC-type transporter Mla MlaB component